MAALLLMGVSMEDIENSVLDPWMDTKQLAGYLGVHPETVRNLTRHRVLTGMAVGGRWRYKRSQVDEELKAWTAHRAAYYSRRRRELAEAKRVKKRRRALGLETDEDSA